MLVETGLVFVLVNVIVFAKPELEPAFVVGGDPDLDVNLLALGISRDDGASGVLPWRLIFLLSLPRVPTDSALTVLLIPLVRETATIFFVVCVVYGSGKPKSPGSSSGWRL